jgi:hypothetical protein
MPKGITEVFLHPPGKNQVNALDDKPAFLKRHHKKKVKRKMLYYMAVKETLMTHNLDIASCHYKDAISVLNSIGGNYAV